MLIRSIIFSLWLVLLLIASSAAQSEYWDGKENALSVHSGVTLDRSANLKTYGFGVALTLTGRFDIGGEMNKYVLNGANREFLGAFADYLVLKPRDWKVPLAVGAGISISRESYPHRAMAKSGTLYLIIYSDSKERPTRGQPTLGVSYTDFPYEKDGVSLLLSFPIRFYQKGWPIIALEPGLSIVKGEKSILIGLTVSVGE